MTPMRVKMDSIVDTVLGIISKCVEATIAGDLRPISEKFQDIDDDNCGICMSELFECTGEDGGVVGVREMKCPGSHKFHSQCLRSWLDHSKRGDCPMCRHNFYHSVRNDCDANLAHQVQPCPTAGFKCVWNEAYEQRVAAIKIIGFCKSKSDLPFGEAVASAVLWSLSEDMPQRDDGDDGGDDIFDFVYDHISDALKVLNPHSVWQYCVSLVKALDVAEDDDQFRILFAMRTVSNDEQYCATLATVGCFSILLNCLNMGSLVDWMYYDMVGDIMFNFVLHEELGPGFLIELLESYKAAQNEDVRARFAAVISEIAKTNEDGCIALISGGTCKALIENLMISNKECNHALQTSQKIEMYTYFGDITSAISFLASTLEGCLALVDAGACDALIPTFRIIWMNNDYLPYSGWNCITSNILRFMNSISRHHLGCVTLIAADVCPELITVLKKIGPILTEYRRNVDSKVFSGVYDLKDNVQTIATILSHLVKNRKGQEELIKADACGALVEILKNPDVVLEDEHIYNIKYCMFRIHSNQDGRVIDALVEGLHEANNDCARSRLSIVIAALYVDFGVGRMSVWFNPTHFVSAGPCGALVEAFKMAGSDCTSTRKEIVGAIDNLSRNIKESRSGFVAAGAVGVLKESLKCCAQALCSSKDCAVISITEIISLLGDPESVAVTGDDHPVKKRNTSDV